MWMLHPHRFLLSYQPSYKAIHMIQLFQCHMWYYALMLCYQIVLDFGFLGHLQYVLWKRPILI